MTRWVPGILSLLVAALPARGGPQVDGVRLPPGFSIAVFSVSVPGARSMTPGARGTLFIGTRDAGAVYRVGYRAP